MPGVLLFLPFLLVRFGLLAAKNRQALPRAAHFAPMQGREKIAYAVYQLATLGDPPGPCAPAVSRVAAPGRGTAAWSYTCWGWFCAPCRSSTLPPRTRMA